MPQLIAQRSSKGLVDLLFDAIDQLNNKKIDAEHARAVSHTAKSIVAVASLELEFRRFSREVSAQTAPLTSLAIEAGSEKESSPP